MVKKVRLKHSGDFMSTGMQLWKKGWFEHPQESGKGGRWNRIIGFSFMFLCSLALKTQLI